MIVPTYWSEAKVRKFVGKRQFTIKRFGWSDISEQAAKAHADARLSEAVRTLESDGDVRRVDHKTSYNGAEGIPIREEVVARHHDVVVSRNAYGARCLNTPDVLFADIDFETEISMKQYVIAFIVLAFSAVLLFVLFAELWLLIVGLVAALVLTPSSARVMRNVAVKANGGAEKLALERIEKVSAADPKLRLRLYRTPLGFRVLIMSDTYNPADTATIDLLEELGSDSVYVMMCKNQNCFRARVSPKPWRIAVDRIRPQPGIWPIKEERMEERRKWIDRYERKARHYASCHYLMTLGSDRVSAKAERVRIIHDELGQVNCTKLNIA